MELEYDAELHRVIGVGLHPVDVIVAEFGTNDRCKSCWGQLVQPSNLEQAKLLALQSLSRR